MQKSTTMSLDTPNLADTMPGPDDYTGSVTRTVSDAPAFGQYKIVRRIGAGAMGVVYEARYEALERTVALKVMQPTVGSTQAGQERFQREAKALARLSHPNVVSIFDIGTHEDQVYSVMEFINGVTLDVWLAEPRTWQEVVRVFLAAGRGLAAAHAAGLVHRDFKPANVMVTRGGHPKILDFGLVRALAGAVEVSNVPSLASVFERRLTKTGALVGTPAYMAPEQIEGQSADTRTDQFAFCIALYEALYGYRPFSGKQWFELTANIVEGNIRPPPDDTQVTPTVLATIRRGLAVDPDARWESMEALLDDLAHTLSPKPEQAPQPDKELSVLHNLKGFLMWSLLLTILLAFLLSKAL